LSNTWAGHFPLHNLNQDGYSGTSPRKSLHRPKRPTGFCITYVNVWEWTRGLVRRQCTGRWPEGHAVKFPIKIPALPAPRQATALRKSPSDQHIPDSAQGAEGRLRICARRTISAANSAGARHVRSRSIPPLNRPVGFLRCVKRTPAADKYQSSGWRMSPKCPGPKRQDLYGGVSNAAEYRSHQPSNILLARRALVGMRSTR